jgi:hypothetical protein
MAIGTPSKIDIPESIEGYKVTLFWGLGIKEVILVFIAILLVGFGTFCLVSHRIIAALGLTVLAGLVLLNLAEVRGRNFYKHLWFIFSYYKTKPQVLIYHHLATSGSSAISDKQLVYQKDNNSKIFIIIFVALVSGLLLLGLALEYIHHVIAH